jgi:hypothetical protein
MAPLAIRPEIRSGRSNTFRQRPVLPFEEQRPGGGDYPQTSTRVGNGRDMATDRETFLALVDRHGAVALGMLRRLCGNGHDAEDVFQDVAVRVWKHLGERPRLRDDRA